MPIIKDLSPSYPVPVVYTYTASSGELAEFKFDAHFKRQSQSAYDAILKLDPADRPADLDLVRDNMVGWSIEDTPYSVDALEKFCDESTGMRAILALAFWHSIVNPKVSHQAAAKNSKP